MFALSVCVPTSCSNPPYPLLLLHPRPTPHTHIQVSAEFRMAKIAHRKSISDKAHVLNLGVNRHTAPSSMPAISLLGACSMRHVMHFCMCMCRSCVLSYICSPPARSPTPNEQALWQQASTNMLGSIQSNQTTSACLPLRPFVPMLGLRLRRDRLWRRQGRQGRGGGSCRLGLQMPPQADRTDRK